LYNNPSQTKPDNCPYLYKQNSSNLLKVNSNTALHKIGEFRQTCTKISLDRSNHVPFRKIKGFGCCGVRITLNNDEIFVRIGS
jgi:hypothetical protein